MEELKIIYFSVGENWELNVLLVVGIRKYMFCLGRQPENIGAAGEKLEIICFAFGGNWEYMFF